MQRTVEAHWQRKLPLLLIVLCLPLLLVACATQPHPESLDPPGFWSGLLHGYIVFFSLVGSIFTDNRIYAFPNSGGWYDCGFFLGAASFFSSLHAGTRSGRKSYGDGDDDEDEDD